MGVNRTVFEAVTDVLPEYGCGRMQIGRFLEGCGARRGRQKQAASIIQRIMVEHDKRKLLLPVVELARVELGIRELEPQLRDHVVHAVLTFLLGIHINKDFLKPSGYGVDTFQWKLAGLFHDVGYPARVARDILEPFTEKINGIKQALGVTAPDVHFRITPIGIDRLTNGVGALDLIQHQLDDWGLAIDTNSEYNDMLDSGGICHGIVSALAVLYVIDLMYQKHNPDRDYRDIWEPAGVNWSQSYFKSDVVPACSAIFVHALPNRCFAAARLARERAPLAFLLRLSDCLQDWDRPSGKNPDGISDDAFEIEITDDRILFTVAESTCRDRIAAEIASCLVASDIEVR